MKPMRKSKDRERGSLDGHFLVAMPGMSDDRFAGTVIYMCAHTSEGSMGIVVNKPAQNLNFPDLLVQLDIITSQDAIMLPSRVAQVNVLRGGPVESGRGFVLHSGDFYLESSTMPIEDGIFLTHTVDILKAIAHGKGPDRAVLALGYAGWSAGQLESEIQRNDWLFCKADFDLIFDLGAESKYDRAMRLMGIDPNHLSNQSGHA
jgi:putative transcriptional regulator